MIWSEIVDRLIHSKVSGARKQCTVNKQDTFYDFGFISMDNVDVSLIFVGKMSAFKYLLNKI